MQPPIEKASSPASVSASPQKTLSLYALNDKNWVRCERVLLIIHGIDLPAAYVMDREFGCTIMGQILQEPAFKDLAALEFQYEQSSDAIESCKRIALQANSNNMKSFVFPEIVLVTGLKLTIGLAYFTNDPDKRAMLVPQGKEQQVRDYLRIR